MNYYGVVAVIVLLGLASVVLARYEYQHPSHKAKTHAIAPTIGSTSYAALAVDDCGTRVPFLTPGHSTGGLSLLASNVIKVSPVSSVDAGANATFAQFTRENTGLSASATSFTVPTRTGHLTATSGTRCAAGTPDAGRTAQVVYATWRTLAATTPTLTTNPDAIKFSQYLRVTMAFVPKGVTPLAPATSTVNAMVQVAVTPTTTTTVPVTTTTAGATTTTVGPATTTTSGTATTTTTTSGTTTTSTPKG